MMPTGGARLRAWGLAAVVGALLLIVALVAGDVPGQRQNGGFLSVDRDAIAAWAVPLIRLGYLALLLVAFYAWLNERQPGGRRRGSKRVSPLATFVVLVTMAVIVLFVLPNLRPDPGVVESSTTTLGVGSPPPEANASEPVSPATSSEWAWWLAAMAGVAGLVYLTGARRSRPGPESRPVGGVPVRTHAVRRAVEHDADPAGRVMAAYRQVEKESARHQLGRAPAETAAGHLRRLGDAVAPEAAASLANLFHWARYSAPPVPDEAAVEAERHGRRIIEELEQ